MTDQSVIVNRRRYRVRMDGRLPAAIRRGRRAQLMREAAITDASARPSAPSLIGFGRRPALAAAKCGLLPRARGFAGLAEETEVEHPIAQMRFDVALECPVERPR